MTPYPHAYVMIVSPVAAYRKASRVYQATQVALGRCPPVMTYDVRSSAGLTFDFRHVTPSAGVSIDLSGLPQSRSVFYPPQNT